MKLSELAEFHFLLDRATDLYKITEGTTKRSIVGGVDEETQSVCVVIFRGKPQDIFLVKQFLERLDDHELEKST